MNQRTHNMVHANRWLMYQIRCTPTVETTCNELYRPPEQSIWNPARPCPLRAGHPDDCTVANSRYSFNLEGAGTAPLKEMITLGYMMLDHGLSRCGMKLVNCDIEMQALRIIRSNEELRYRG